MIGLMARYGSEKIRGHGIPEALEAILFGRSRMEPKIAVLKPLSSAISIGTGGPFGAEGPIIMTGGAVGSIFAQFFHLSSAERKTLLVAGVAGGMAAIFASPVAAALSAIELLLFEWRPRSFIPVAIAAATAATLRVPLLGAGPIFSVHPHATLGGEGLFFAFIVGTIAGLGSGLLTTMVYGFEDLFNKLPFHWMWWPAIGGLCVGIGGLIEPSVLGVGYETIYRLLRGDIVGPALPLTLVRVGEVMDKDAVIVRANMPLIELSDRIARHEPEVSRHQGLLIADENGHLTGIITRGDIVHALEQNGHNDSTVAMAGSGDLVVTFPDEVLHEAAIKMLRNNIGRLPVVSRADARHIVGYFGRSNLMVGHLRQLEEEHLRERRFLRRRPKESNLLA
jgi:CBS domain-containing protein